MKPAPIPENESKRLEALRRYAILDTLPESAFDELTRLAADTCNTPIGLISFCDEQRVWFKSRIGIQLTEVPRAGSFCAYTILQDDIFIIKDAKCDDRFIEAPILQAVPPIRFYAGMSLSTPDGSKIGTLAVLDQNPRELQQHHKEALKILARQVATQLELRRHLVTLARSVEEHKRTEEQLRTSEAFYHMLVETLPQNIFRKDVQGRFTFCNKQFAHSVGRRIEEIVGKTDFDFFPPELAAKYHRDDLRVMNTLETFETIEAHQTPGGEKLFVHVIKTPLYDPMGLIIGIQGIFWDVTQRKRTEEALAYERDLLRALLDNIPDRIYFKDVESRFLRCSTSMALRLGLEDPKEVIGKTDFDFHPKELAQEFYADEQRIILTGRPLISKLERQLDLHGGEIWASVTKVPTYNQNGHITGIIGISRDVTRLKHTELALQQARDTALQSARVKSQFLANMSHEIRTPMNAIVGMTGLLLDTLLNQEQQEFVQTIRESTQALLGIINEILDYSKVEAGKFNLEIIEFDLRETVESTLEMLSENASSKGIELLSWVDHALPQVVRGDPGRFRQILANLLSNAVKFTENGEVLVRVTKAEETETVVMVQIAVRDTGIGIDAKVMPSIFDAFTQADGSTTRKYGGTGLGLAISKQLAELMGGQIGVESTPGKGSTFWFKLPFEKIACQPEKGGLWHNFHFPGLRILAVEDHETTRQLLQHLLEPLALAGFAAVTKQAAMQTLLTAAQAANAFDCIVIGLGRSEGEGIELIRRIKGEPLVSKARVVVLTSLGKRLNPALMQQTGISACVGKPLRSARLYACLKRVTDPNADTEAHAMSSESVLLEGEREQMTETRHVRILVAEDNMVNQRLALMQLQKLGYHADAVGNGTEVLQALEQVPYNIILMDCQMPEMDGYEVSRRIRQSEAVQSTPSRPKPYIIALTANALAGDRETCLAAGMNDYLLKPLHLPELDRALRQALSKLRAQDLVGSPPPSFPDALDLSILNSIRSLRQPNQPDPARDLIDLFLKDARVKLEKLEAAIPNDDAPTVLSTAHSLKGSSSNLGARRLAAACARLEKEVKAGKLSESANILLDVKSEFEHVEKLLFAELQK